MAWTLIDRIELSGTATGDLIRERVSYFDPLPLLGTLLRPSVLWRLVRARRRATARA